MKKKNKKESILEYKVTECVVILF